MAKLDNINLIARSLEQTKHFYCEILAFREDLQCSAPPHFLMLQDDGCSSSLQDAAAMGQQPSAGTGLELGFAAGDMASVEEKLHHLYPQLVDTVGEVIHPISNSVTIGDAEA